MFPNQTELFMRERAKERQAELEQIRLGKLVGSTSLTWQHRLGRLIYWLGCRLTGWGFKLQYPTPEREALPWAMPEK